MRERADLERAALELARTTPATDGPAAFADRLRVVDRDILLRSAALHGTPQYFLDVDALRARAAWFSGTFRRHIPAAECCYAFKCNDLPTLVSAVRDEGFHADVAGLFELKLALRLGFGRILFSGPGKSEEELLLAIGNADRVVVNIDNLDELALLRRLAEGRTGAPLRVGLRVNTATGAGGAWWKFGLDMDELPGALSIVDASPGLEWIGLHFHGSWNKKPEGYVRQIERIGAWLRSNVEPGRLRFLDVGGGFYPEDQALLAQADDPGMLVEAVGSAVGDRAAAFAAAGIDPYAFRMTPVEPLEEFAAAIAGAIDRYVRPDHPDVTVYLEPGRFIATFATTILLRVVAVKKRAVIVDGGVNMLGDYKLAEYSFAPVLNLTRPSNELRRRIICGSLCDPADLWGYSHYGEELRVGDVLAVLHQGAYTFSGAWRFIKSIPAYVARSGRDLFVAREGETFDVRYAGCRL